MIISANLMVLPSVGDSAGMTQASPVVTAVHHDLLARQNGGPVCGYVNADIAFPLSCPSGYQCGINTHDYAFNCCQNVANCYYQTACVPYASLEACNAACQADPYVTKCVDKNYPYCYVKSFHFTAYTGAFLEYDCLTASGFETVWQTFTQKTSVTVQVQPVIITVTQTTSVQPSTTQVSSTKPPPFSAASNLTSVSPTSTPQPSQNNVPTRAPLTSSQQAVPAPSTSASAPAPASNTQTPNMPSPNTSAPAQPSNTQTPDVPSPNTSDTPANTIVVTEEQPEQPSAPIVESSGAQKQSVASTSIPTLTGDGGTSCNGGGQNCNDPTNNGGTQQIVQIHSGSGRLRVSFSFLGVSGILAVTALMFLHL